MLILPHVDGSESHKLFSRQVRYFCPLIVVPTEQIYSAVVDAPSVVIVTVPFTGGSSDGHATTKYNSEMWKGGQVVRIFKHHWLYTCPRLCITMHY